MLHDRLYLLYCLFLSFCVYQQTDVKYDPSASPFFFEFKTGFLHKISLFLCDFKVTQFLINLRKSKNPENVSEDTRYMEAVIQFLIVG